MAYYVEMADPRSQFRNRIWGTISWSWTCSGALGRLELDERSLKHELTGEINYKCPPLDLPEGVSKENREIFSLEYSRWDPPAINWRLLPKFDYHTKEPVMEIMKVCSLLEEDPMIIDPLKVDLIAVPLTVEPTHVISQVYGAMENQTMYETIGEIMLD